MTVISYTSARGSFAETMRKVCDDHDPVIITRQNAESVVMLSLEDYEALCETNYLLQTPKNAQRLMNSIKELESGSGKVRDLAE